jgi:predicted alpha/beta-hydrolase family hydrolase
MKPYVDQLAKLGVDCSALRLPRGAAERAIPALRDQVGSSLPTSVIGGHSFGGRVASMVAAETSPAGLVLLSYPLHRPGHPDELKDAHWEQIACPVLLLSGDRDQFARTDRLERSVRRFAHAELHVYPGLRHGLLSVAPDVAGRIAKFVRGL